MALGQLGHADEQLHGPLLQEAAQRLQQQRAQDGSSRFTAQELCNISWSVAVLDLQQHTDQLLPLVQACSQQWQSMQVEGMRQLFQVHLWLLDCQSAAGAEQRQGLQGVLSALQLQQCEAAWRQQLQADSPT